jgi:asparagine synthase (glutamine-hydrolysing)
LATVVDDHTMSDVPVGVYLSGGLDSSIVAAIAAERVGLHVPTFSLAFDNADYDESSVARQVASHLRLPNHPVPAEPMSVHELERSVYFLEEPQVVTLDASVSRLARAAQLEDVRVVLGGDGADELFGGYDHFVANELRQAAAGRPGGPAGLGQGLRRLGYPPDFCSHYLELTERADSIVDRYGFFPPWYPIWELNDRIKSPLFDGRLRPSLAPGGPLAPACAAVRTAGHATQLDQAVHFESLTRLPKWILSRTDRNAMSSSVEVRVPYLDRRIVGLIGDAREGHAAQPFDPKRPLREAFAAVLPADVLNRRKFAFNTPMAWLFDSTTELVTDLLSPQTTREVGLFDVGGVERLYRLVRGGPARPSSIAGELSTRALVAVLTTHLVHRQFVDASQPAGAARGGAQ